MDTIIQGLTQSAIVQKLSEQENNLKRFTHDIPDNAPIRSIQKTEVPPYIGRELETDDTYRYRIPRKGYLNKMWLKCRIGWAGNLNHDHGRGITRFGDFLESVSLFVGGNRIETLYPESIAYNVMTYKTGPCQTNTIRGMAGLETNGYADDFTRSLNFGYARNSFETIDGAVDFLIPFDFSIMRHFKDSMDTNFLQNMEVELKVREIPNRARHYFVTRLVCKYHNVQNNFRTNLRNANHSKETTTKLITRSLKVTSTPEYEYLETPFPDIPYRYTYTIPNIEDITDILISFNRTATSIVALGTGIYQKSPNSTHRLSFRLLVNDKVILDKAHWELLESNTDIHSHSLGDRLDPSQALSNAGKLGDIDFNYSLSSGEAQNYLDQFYKHLFHSFMYVIPFHMFGTDEFYNGALNAKSLGNVKLEIVSEDFSQIYTPTDFDSHLVPQVILRHSSLARIDNKTGLIIV